MQLEEMLPPEELDVQKAVVESLAADKAVQDEKIAALERELAALKASVAQKDAALRNVGDVLTRNTEDGAANRLALLDRDLELPDRFPGETRDHVLEAVREARDRAEAEGRRRRAQVLESVLVANEPNGTLNKKRATLEKLFADNQNILTGPVIDELTKLGLSHKEGENYLLPAEIIKRNY